MTTKIQSDPKPLTAAEAERAIAETTARLVAAVQRGDRDAYRLAFTDQRFNLDSLEAAKKREADEAAATHAAAIEAEKPAALEALRQASPAVAFASEIADVERAIALLIGVARRGPEARKRLDAAQRRAKELAPRARLPWAGPVDPNGPVLYDQLRAVVDRAVFDADISMAEQSGMPTFAIVPRSLMSGPGSFSVRPLEAE